MGIASQQKKDEDNLRKALIDDIKSKEGDQFDDKIEFLWQLNKVKKIAALLETDYHIQPELDENDKVVFRSILL